MEQDYISTGKKPQKRGLDEESAEGSSAQKTPFFSRDMAAFKDQEGSGAAVHQQSNPGASMKASNSRISQL
jgi:hypothetical protein